MDQSASLTAASAFLLPGLVSHPIQGPAFTGRMLFAAFGLSAGPAFLGLTPLEVGDSTLHLLAEITLVLVLFCDAANIDLRQVRRVSAGASSSSSLSATTV